MPSPLLVCLLLGFAAADIVGNPDSIRHGRVRREDISVEDIVRAAAAEFEVKARAAANDTVAQLEERLAGLEDRLAEHSALLEQALSALAKLSKTMSRWQRGSRQAGPDRTAVGPQPSDRPSPTVGRVLGEPCHRDPDCSDLLTDTRCVGGLCTCGTGLLRGPGETCRRAPSFGQECRTNRQCRVVTPGAVCFRQVCRCPQSLMTFHRPYLSQPECRPFPGLSEECRTDADCRSATMYAMCSTDTLRCVCPPGYWNYRNAECRPGVSEKGACLYDRDCSIISAINTCIDGRCKVRRCDTQPDSTDRFRLIGGTNCTHGFVEFTYDSGASWNLVCDRNWTQADATVLCVYMGFDWGEPRRSGRSENMPGFLWVADLECDGTEANPTLCVWHDGRTECPAREAAAVQCFLNPIEPPTTDLPTTEGTGDE